MKPVEIGRIIELAHWGKVVNWSGKMSADYPRLVMEFLGMLEERKIPFVIVGGIALLQYVSGRNTEDIDLIISSPKLMEIPELQLREKNELFGMGNYQGLRVDLLFLEHPFFGLIARGFTTAQKFEVGMLATATVEGLVLLKLFALPSLYRQYDVDRIAIYEADILQLLARTETKDSFFLKTLEPFIPETDLNELRSVLEETRRKLKRIQPSN